jgi:hypothetical protein
MRKWLASLALVAVGIASVPVAAQQQQRVPLPQLQPQQQQQQTQQQAQQRPPNILVIMGDDVGWFNISAYHRGIMSGKTPNLDRLASEGPERVFVGLPSDAPAPPETSRKVPKLAVNPNCHIKGNAEPHSI